ncbi:MAG: PD40 domain-containing protein [Flavobacteriaceae bacterium]|nr:PD40 domain-containing protein [Flavobacteriaceae bacterium]
MKPTLLLTFAAFIFAPITHSNSTLELSNLTGVDPTETSKTKEVSNNTGFEYYSKSTPVNTKYSEFASGIFKKKFIIVSSKRIGALGDGVDKYTCEPFTELYCLDLKKDATIENPLFFSKILNTKNNEGHVAFTANQNTIYYTRSLRTNAKNYQLFKATLDTNSTKTWVNHKQVTSNKTHSIETPLVSADGKSIYYSSNKPGGFGGFDLYVAPIKEDGTIGTSVNLGPTVNTDKNEKYPQLTKDGKRLFFASNGHKGFGGMDLFVSRKLKDGYKTPRNLGKKVNTASNELALTFIDNELGYFSSNKKGGKGSYDLYQIEMKPVFQKLEGTIVDNDSERLLPNATVVLYDADHEEIARQTTGKDANFSFKVLAFEDYTVKVKKEGFENTQTLMTSGKSYTSILKTVVKLHSDTGLAKKK